MQTIILLTEEDIVTTTIGSHMEIRPNSGPIINLSYPAAKELMNDLTTILPILEEQHKHQQDARDQN